MKKDIAIVGMSCRFPDADSINAYWENLKQGKQSIKQLSEEELGLSGISENIYNQDNYVRAASYIRDIEYFDAGFFKYSPREAALLDPQQRIMLELSYEALESAGYNGEYDTQNVGVFMGSGYNQYLLKNILRGRSIVDNSEEFFIQTSNDKDYLSSRISYKLNLHGPSVNIQTACSTSLVAVHFARKSLLLKECDWALAGGVTLRLPQKQGYFYEPEMITSNDGRCCPFDKEANGTVFGSGAGVVVLRRLEDAIKDGDNILCIIKGSAINNDGQDKVGYTAPSLSGQQAVLNSAIKDANIPVNTISAVEAHGTGTKMGDPIEFDALASVFNGVQKKCVIGSVKGNIGHLENAAGIAGLIKMILSLKNKTLVPSVNYTSPNPFIDIENSPFYINTETKYWENSANDYPRRCGVSSFGIGGTNAHIILEEYVSECKTFKQISKQDYYPINISADSKESLLKNKKALLEHLQNNTDIELSKISYTLTCCRKAYKHRCSYSCSSTKELTELLKREKDLTSIAGDIEVVFMFPGQGSQFVGMAIELYDKGGVFKEEVDRLMALFQQHLDVDLRSVLWGYDNPQNINDTIYAQPILFIIEYALGKQLIAYNIVPDIMVGHSIGEFAAFCLAGMISIEDAVILVSRRASLMHVINKGKMYSVHSEEDFITSLLPIGLSIAAINTKDLLVVSGNEEAMEKFLQTADENGITYRQLHTSAAFHSCLMEPVLDDFYETAKQVTFNPAKIKVASTLNGEIIHIGQSISAKYLANQIRRPVRFKDAVASIIELAPHAFVEVGPGITLKTFIKRIDHQINVVNLLPTMNSNLNSQYTLLSGLGNIWSWGVKINWRALFSADERNFVSLPTYQFNRKRYWIQSVEQTAQQAGTIYKSTNVQEDNNDTSNISKEDFLSEKQRALLKIFSSVLGVEDIRLSDNFFEMGGHSLLATRILSRINKEFSCEIHLKEFMEYPTIRALSDRIEMSDKVDLKLPPIVEDPDHLYTPFPLTEMQEAQWLGRVEAFDTSGVAAHLYFEVENYDLCPLTVSRAWQKLIERHDMLRTVIMDDGTQKILPLPLEYKIKINDFSNMPIVDMEGKLQEIRAKMDSVVRPIDQWPLFEVQCSILPQNRIRIHFSLDLIICDVASLRILMKEWALLYSNMECELPSIDLKFRDYVLAEKKIRDCDVYKTSEAYWDKRIKTLSGRPELPLKKADLSEALHYKRLSYTIETTLWEKLKEICGRKKISPSMVLLAGFSEILACWSQNKRFCINTTIINRHPLHPHVNRLVGEFASFAPIEANFIHNTDFESLVLNLQQENWNNLENRYVHGTTILRKIAKERGNTIGSVLPIVFTSTIVHDASGENLFHEVFGDYNYVLSQTPQVWLDHAVFENIHGLMLSWHFIDNIFETGVIDEMFNAYIKLILSLCEQTIDWNHHYYDLIPCSHLQAIKKYNTTNKPICATTLHQLFFNSCKDFGGKVAIISKEKQISYDKLRELVLFHSSTIKEKNIEKEKPVVVLMEKGWEQVVAVLSILNAGYAYLPLTIETPVERVKYVINETECRLIISKPKHRELLENYQGVDIIHVEDLDIDLSMINLPTDKASPSDTAYIIYTSGSTGKPKGVVISHKGAVNTILDINDRFKIKSSDSILALSELSFDLSVYDIFGMLAVGGTIVMPESRMAKDPESWHKLVTEHNISIWNTVPALMEMYAEYVTNIFESNNICIRLALLSGDWISLSLPKKLKALNPQMEIRSLGGATEASIWSIYFPINRVCKEWQSIPYGKPLANQTILILDDLLKPCPIYATGNIYIGGLGVANGYYKDKEKTEGAFLKLKGSNDVIYKTGDLGRMLPDRNVEFLGRADSQVKIGGYRIELGEIESCMSAMKGVKACVVVLTKPKRKIRAFVQLDDKERLTTNEIQEKLSLVLPHYMIPQEISVVSTFPLTSNGKIDRKCLSEKTPSYNNNENGISVNNTDIDKYDIIIDVFAEMLGSDKSMIDINQNFFSMGGDSILGVKIISKLKQHGIILSPRMIFEHPTIRDLMEAYVASNDEKIMPSNTMQLSAYQQILIDKYGDEIFAQNHVVLLELKGQIEPERLDQGVSTLCPLFDTLKGKLFKSKDKWELHVIPNCSYEIDFVDKIPENTSFEDYIESITNEFIRDFYSGETPLLRICLLKHKNKSYLLVVSNKLILDLYSVDLLLKLLFNNMYYGTGISKEITERIASLNDIASLYKSYDTLQDTRFVPKFPIKKLNIPFSLRMREICLRKIEDTEIIALLIRCAVSCLKLTNDNQGSVRYTIPRDYENLLEHSLEGTCGNFLMTNTLPVRLNDLSVNLSELKKIIFTQSIDLDMQGAANIHTPENVPSIEIVYYGNIISRDTQYYNIINLRNSSLKSHSEVTIEAFVLNDQLDISIFIEENATFSGEIQKRFEKILLEEFESLKKKSAVEASDFNRLKISKEDLNELIFKISSYNEKDNK